MAFREDCKSKIQSSNMDQETKDYLVNFVDKLDESYREKGSGESFDSFADRAVRDQLYALQGERQDVLNNIIKASDVRQRIKNSAEALGPSLGKEQAAAEGYHSIFYGADQPLPGANISIDSRRRSMMGQFQKVFNDLDTTKGSSGESLLGILQENTLFDEIYREVYELENGRSGGVTGSADALAIARHVDKFNEIDLKIKQKAGIFVNKKASYLNKQVYVREKLLDKFPNPKEFAAYMSKHVDLSASFKNSSDISKSFMNMHAEIKKGKNIDFLHVFDAESGKAQARTLKDRLADKFEASRDIVFKDGQSFATVMRDIGEDNFLSSLVKRAENTAEAASLIDRMGTNPEQTHNDTLAWLRDTYGEAAFDKSKGLFDKANTLFKTARGYTPADGMRLKAKEAGGAARSAMAFTKLALSSANSVTDLAYHAFGYKSATGENAFAHTVKGVDRFASAIKGGNEGRKFWASKMGLYQDAMQSRLQAAISDNTGLPGMIVKGASLTRKLNFFDIQSEASRDVAGITAGDLMARKLDGNFSDLNVQVQKTLGRYNINEHVFDLMKGSAKEYTYDGDWKERVVDPGDLEAHLNNLSEDQIAKAKSASGFTGSSNKFKNRIVDDYRDMVNDMTALTSPNPGIRAKAALRFATDPNTLPGIAVDMITQFKSFTVNAMYNFKRNIVSLPGNEKMGFPRALATPGGFSHAAQMGAALTLLGSTAVVLKDLAKGKVSDPSDPKTYKRLLTEGALNGFLGIWGDAVAAVVQREDFTGWAFGPFYQTARDIGTAGVRATKDVLPESLGGNENGTSSKALEKMFKVAIKQIPNVPLAGAAIKDHLTYWTVRGLDPDNLERYESSMENYDESLGRSSIYDSLTRGK